MRNRIAVLVLLFLGSMMAIQAQPAQANCTPGISFWKLLDGVGIGYRDGRLNLNKLYAVCLPAPAKQSTSNYPYDPDSGGKLTTLVKTSDGKLLNTYVWYASSIGGLWELSHYKVVGGYEAVQPLTPGNYLLEFAAEDKPFTRFPFSVIEVKNADPYKPAGNSYFIKGAWDEYGNIFYQRNDPASVLTFTTWVQDVRGSQNQASIPHDVKLLNLKDGKAIGEEIGTLTMEPHWLEFKVFFHPLADKNAFLKAGDLLKEDGKYVVKLVIDNKAYGDYPFTVKAGRIEFQGRQVREKTEPMSYIVDYPSGGRYSSWWIPR